MNPASDKISVALVDDHTLFRKGVVELINGFSGYYVCYEADNGKQLIEKVQQIQVPDIVLLDISMPVMDGYETAEWLKNNYADIKILALSMNDDEISIINMLRSGAIGYVLKDAEPKELYAAFEQISKEGFYHSAFVSQVLINNIHNESRLEKNSVHLNEREIEFMQHIATELTYREIADIMCLSPRTIDGYRESLFEKLQVKNRIGLVIYAIKNGIISIK
ncbi:two-component system invasion response regulator UvrY [Catalinimonas alkaloidigena]|uniref:response regulator n=1 Tax=Catalinimonas alkaloidigena TaxID=1075417 RepID=UPI002406EAAA|nr:response regulator transcription factor [Catalinimonas alkaloidigena]MDF9797130.1 two-component system invasion response regulator UvrY [Catalinimonas alkaloidigena]